MTIFFFRWGRNHCFPRPALSPLPRYQLGPPFPTLTRGVNGALQSLIVLSIYLSLLLSKREKTRGEKEKKKQRPLRSTMAERKEEV